MLRFIAQQTKSLKILQPIIRRTLSQQAVRVHETAPKEKWDLLAGVLVERLPVVSKSLNEIEREFQELLWRVELENSLKSDHELQHERDLQLAEKLKSGQGLEQDTDENYTKVTAQDKEDAYAEELKAFAPAARTEQQTLYLLVQQQLGKEQTFLLPQGVRQEGETMRQTAERVLKQHCGPELIVQFYGNAPCGFHKYKYPSDARQASVGAKLFFYRARMQHGDVQQCKFTWLPKSELSTKLTNHNYLESINKFLL